MMLKSKIAKTASLRKQGGSSAQPKSRGRKTPWLFIALCMAPWVIGFVGFTLYPMAASFYQSFTKWDMINAPRWIGVDNYVRMFTRDRDFIVALKNTLWISAVSIPIRIAFAMGTAWVMTKPKRGVGIYRTIFFIPSMVPTVAATLVFTVLFNPSVGTINMLLEKIGISDPPYWFNDPNWSKWGLIIMGLWGIGDTMLIFLAGLLDIDKSLYEAASLDGANSRQTFFRVTLPLMTPVIFFSTVTGIIGSFQYFTQAYVVSGQVNDFTHSMYFYATHIYMQAFQAYQMGYAAALAWFLLFITLLCTLVMLRTQKRWVHYPNGSLFK